MKWYTVYLFRSGRVWVMEGKQAARPWPKHIDPPLLSREVEANTEIAALGKLLLEYIDRASQTFQHIPICIESCCRLCKCGEVQSKHTPANLNIAHTFDPIEEEPT